MSKSLLVVDTPKSCSECKMNYHRELEDGYFEESCKIIGCIETLDRWNDLDVPTQCPLQDITEVLEGYQLSKKEVYSINGLEIRCSVVINNVHHRVTKETYEILNKLRKALGGNDNE